MLISLSSRRTSPLFFDRTQNNRALHHQSALSQKILDIPIAKREPEVEPDSMSDDVRWKSVAGEGDGLHDHPGTSALLQASARTLAKDSHILQDVRVWRHGPDCQYYRRSRRSRALARHCRRWARLLGYRDLPAAVLPVDRPAGGARPPDVPLSHARRRPTEGRRSRVSGRSLCLGIR